MTDDLDSFREKLEANLGILNKFEGLESDLIQQHGNLRSQFSEYREAIEAANLCEKDKNSQFSHYDELLKKLHKLILEAKAMARKRTEQMTRDELFKVSQDRQKSLKPQSAEDKIGDEVTKSLKRMLETMRSEVERSSSNISTAKSTTKVLKGTTENYENLSGTLEESRGLIRDLWRNNRMDMIYIFGALGIFISTAVWVILQRTPGVVWVPGKVLLRQLGNLIPKSVEKIAEAAGSVLSDSESDEPPKMFIDTIERDREEYGSDELLKSEEVYNDGSQIKKETSNIINAVEHIEPTAPVELVENDPIVVESPVEETVLDTPEYVSKSIEVEQKTEIVENVEPVMNKKEEPSTIEEIVQPEVIVKETKPGDDAVPTVDTTQEEQFKEATINTEAVQESISASEVSVNTAIDYVSTSEMLIDVGVGEADISTEVTSNIQPTHDSSFFEVDPATIELSNEQFNPTEAVIQSTEAIIQVQPTESITQVIEATKIEPKLAEIVDTRTVMAKESPTSIFLTPTTPSNQPIETASESEGSQKEYSSDAELFSGSEEKMEI